MIVTLSFNILLYQNNVFSLCKHFHLWLVKIICNSPPMNYNFFLSKIHLRYQGADHSMSQLLKITINLSVLVITVKCWAKWIHDTVYKSAFLGGGGFLKCIKFYFFKSLYLPAIINSGFSFFMFFLTKLTKATSHFLNLVPFKHFKF